MHKAGNKITQMFGYEDVLDTYYIFVIFFNKPAPNALTAFQFTGSGTRQTFSCSLA
jgi:hypothetical protein